VGIPILKYPLSNEAFRKGDRAWPATCAIWQVVTICHRTEGSWMNLQRRQRP
jgi:hypothetical protein